MLSYLVSGVGSLPAGDIFMTALRTRYGHYIVVLLFAFSFFFA